MAFNNWRPMRPDDLPAVKRIADSVHPEDSTVYSERLVLYAPGCFVLHAALGVAGYAISHPWHLDAPPPLNSALGAITVPSSYYIHDVTLAPQARGADAAAIIVRQLIGHAAASGLPNLSLVAIPGMASFWARFGFRERTAPGLAAKLSLYGAGSQYMLRDVAP